MLNLYNRVNKPWGYYEDIERTPSYVFKRLVVFPGKRTSLQSHLNRKETWNVVSGLGQARIQTDISGRDMEMVVLKPGEVVMIDKTWIHRISNIDTNDLIIYEFQFGSCSEEDIIRYEDDFGR